MLPGVVQRLSVQPVQKILYLWLASVLSRVDFVDFISLATAATAFLFAAIGSFFIFLQRFYFVCLMSLFSWHDA